MKFITGLILALTLCVGAFSQTVIVGWNLTGLVGDEGAATASAKAEHVLAGDIAGGPGVTGTAGANSLNFNGWSDGSSLDYISLSLTIEAGYEANLESVSFGTRSSSGGPGYVGLYWSGDNFTDPVHLITQGNGTYTNSVLDLSDFDPVTGTVEFRLMKVGFESAVHGNLTPTGTLRITNWFGGDPTPSSVDVRFTGTVSAVPEPSAFALVTGALAALTACAQRPKRHA